MKLYIENLCMNFTFTAQKPEIVLFSIIGALSSFICLSFVVLNISHENKIVGQD